MSMSYSTKVALARASRARAHRSKTSVVSGTKRQDHKEYIEKNAEKMISDVEDMLLIPVSKSIADQKRMLNPNSTSWYPECNNDKTGGLFVLETGRDKCLDIIPDGIVKNSTYKGFSTYYPDRCKFYKYCGNSVGEWDNVSGVEGRSEGRDMVGSIILILVKRCGGTQLGNPDSDWIIPIKKCGRYSFYNRSNFYLKYEHHVTANIDTLNANRDSYMRSGYFWMFALIDCWDGETEKHTLTFRDNNVFYTIPDVNLRNCVFQKRTRNDVENFNFGELMKSSFNVSDCEVKVIERFDLKKNVKDQLDKEANNNLKKTVITKRKPGVEIIEKVAEDNFEPNISIYGPGHSNWNNSRHVKEAGSIYNQEEKVDKTKSCLNNSRKIHIYGLLWLILIMIILCKVGMTSDFKYKNTSSQYNSLCNNKLYCCNSSIYDDSIKNDKTEASISDQKPGFIGIIQGVKATSDVVDRYLVNTELLIEFLKSDDSLFMII